MTLYSKGELVREIYGDTRDIDFALPMFLVDKIVETLGCSDGAIIGNFVYSYRDHSHGTLCPVTETGVELLRIINKVMEVDFPFPEKIFHTGFEEVMTSEGV